MDDFALDNVDDVMRHTPGITVSAYDTDRTNYYSRGFSINNFQYDGIPSAVCNVAYSAGNTLSDMAIYDRIEVLKGASGPLSGASSLEAPSNLVRKKPTTELQGHITAGAGSWDNYRTEVDVSGPLTETGNVRGRAVAAYQDKQSYIDRYSNKSSLFYGILEFDLSPDTLLTVGSNYQDSKPKGSTWWAASRCTTTPAKSTAPNVHSATPPTGAVGNSTPVRHSRPWNTTWAMVG